MIWGRNEWSNVLFVDETHNGVQIRCCRLVFILPYLLLLSNEALIAQYYRDKILVNVVFLHAVEIDDKFHVR